MLSVTVEIRSRSDKLTILPCDAVQRTVQQRTGRPIAYAYQTLPTTLGKKSMIQKYAFTTAAMAAALEDTPVSYEDLAEIEKDFDDAETEISKSVLFFQGTIYLCMRPPVALRSVI